MQFIQHNMPSVMMTSKKSADVSYVHSTSHPIWHTLCVPSFKDYKNLAYILMCIVNISSISSHFFHPTTPPNYKEHL